MGLWLLLAGFVGNAGVWAAFIWVCTCLLYLDLLILVGRRVLWAGFEFGVAELLDCD